VANWRPFLDAQGIALRYEPVLTDAEYTALTASGSPLRKLGSLTRAAARLPRIRDHDQLILVHRVRFPAPIPGVEGRPLDIYDFDDAVYLGSPTTANRRFAWVKRETTRTISYLTRSRLVLAGNSYLASYARSWNQQVEVVPSCVDVEASAQREHVDTPAPTLGWLGSPFTTRYLAEFLSVWERFREHFEGARLLLVGADTGLSGPGIEHRSWSPEIERAALAEIDIGIMPLPDNPWTRGKCGYKLLQYFAAGVPAVASNVGTNRELLASGAGLAASEPNEWLDGLRQLASDVGLRREMGTTGRDFAAREYSYTAWAPRLAELLRRV
jgi:glycosyltransferase involved in cell wall biosynthesis